MNQSITGRGSGGSGWTGFQCWTTNISHHPSVEPISVLLAWHKLRGKPSDGQRAQHQKTFIFSYNHSGNMTLDAGDSLTWQGEAGWISGGSSGYRALKTFRRPSCLHPLWDEMTAAFRKQLLHPALET
ncbi:hypothetical protein NQZ68_038216 [Dissostichus eleginoides]|nr:hypothetical protein NQZ68_038216 [Dissostichus eleginoides]